MSNNLSYQRNRQSVKVSPNSPMPSKGFVDTKEFRKNLLTQANDRLGVILKAVSDGNGSIVSKESGMLHMLDSSYKAEVPSTVYAMHLKSIAFESAIFLITTQKVIDDLYFRTTRGEYLSQNIASFVFPNNRFAHATQSDEQVRGFYLSIIESYFGGSTLSNIERSLLRFLNVPVGLVENFLLAREDSTIDEIVKKFTFDIVVQVDDPRIKNITQLQKDIEFLLSIIKPAHTAYQTKFIFTELFDIFRRGCFPVYDPDGFPLVTHDGFDIVLKQTNTSICDTQHIDAFDYYYEDLRKNFNPGNFLPVVGEIVQKQNTYDFDIHQASPRLVKWVTGGLWDYTDDPSIFHVRHGPLCDATGFLKMDEQGSWSIQPSDVTVYVNGDSVPVLEVFPLSSCIKLASVPPAGAEVKIDYYFIKNYLDALTTNSYDSVINNFSNQATEIKYKTVLWPAPFQTSEEIPLVNKYRYKGFDLFNSSVLNDTNTLVFNQLSLRNRLNDADVFKSLGYDSDIYNTELNYGTTPVPVSLDKKDVWRRLPFQEFRLNNAEFIMNNREDRLFGEIHYPSYHPFYSALELDILGNGGTTGILSSIAEDPKDGFILNLQRKIEEEYVGLGQDVSETLYTFPYSASGYNSDFVLIGGGAIWDTTQSASPTPSSPTKIKSNITTVLDSYSSTATYDVVANLGGNYSSGHLLIDSCTKEDNSFVQDLQVLSSFSLLNKEEIENIFTVFNLTKSSYDLSFNSLSNLYNLDESLDINSTIGLSSGDLVSLIYLDNYYNTIEKDLSVVSVSNYVFECSGTIPQNFVLINKTKKVNSSPSYFSLDNLERKSILILNKYFQSSEISEGDIIKVSYLDSDNNTVLSEVGEIVDRENYKIRIASDCQYVYSIFNETKSINLNLNSLHITHLICLEQSWFNKNIEANLSSEVFVEYLDINDTTRLEKVSLVGPFSFKVEKPIKSVNFVKNNTANTYDLGNVSHFSYIKIDKTITQNDEIDLYLSDTVEVIYSDGKHTHTEIATVVDASEFILKTINPVILLKSVQNLSSSQDFKFYDLTNTNIRYFVDIGMQTTPLSLNDVISGSYLSTSAELITEEFNPISSFIFEVSSPIYQDVTDDSLQLYTLRNITLDCVYDLTNIAYSGKVNLTDDSSKDAYAHNSAIGLGGSDDIFAYYVNNSGFIKKEKLIIGDLVNYSFNTSEGISDIHLLYNLTRGSYNLTNLFNISSNTFQLEGSLQTLVTSPEDVIITCFEDKNKNIVNYKTVIVDPTQLIFRISKDLDNILKIENHSRFYNISGAIISGNTIELSLPQSIPLQFGDDIEISYLDISSNLIIEKASLLFNKSIPDYFFLVSNPVSSVNYVKNIMSYDLTGAVLATYSDQGYSISLDPLLAKNSLIGMLPSDSIRMETKSKTLDYPLYKNKQDASYLNLFWLNTLDVPEEIPLSSRYEKVRVVSTAGEALKFLTNKKVVVEGMSDAYFADSNIKITSIKNYTQWVEYDLTNMTLFDQRVIVLDPSLNPNPPAPEDEIYIAYTSVDTMGVYPQPLTTIDALNYVFQSDSQISSLLSLYSSTPLGRVYFDVSGAVISGKQITLTLPQPPLGQDDKIFAEVVVVESRYASPVISYATPAKIKTFIDMISV